MPLMLLSIPALSFRFTLHAFLCHHKEGLCGLHQWVLSPSGFFLGAASDKDQKRSEGRRMGKLVPGLLPCQVALLCFPTEGSPMYTPTQLCSHHGFPPLPLQAWDRNALGYHYPQFDSLKLCPYPK